ncbi:hypothetical protein [Vibrio agarivorans]|uniref:Uncharacterized protein n=1 Tax=Vibrio agarivorans TaxID=153622 RepID=A0ABT7Y7D5_9VIBR|nr:hypothetical protein [Vibrio agarivorans]MDN2483901.1 hypothetical protein [Vibrio agarivorans]
MNNENYEFDAICLCELTECDLVMLASDDVRVARFNNARTLGVVEAINEDVSKASLVVSDLMTRHNIPHFHKQSVRTIVLVDRNLSSVARMALEMEYLVVYSEAIVGIPIYRSILRYIENCADVFMYDFLYLALRLCLTTCGSIHSPTHSVFDVQLFNSIVNEREFNYVCGDEEINIRLDKDNKAYFNGNLYPKIDLSTSALAVFMKSTSIVSGIDEMTRKLGSIVSDDIK